MRTLNFTRKFFKSNFSLLIISALLLGSLNFVPKSAQAGNCVIDSLVATPSVVASGNTATIGWTQTGCASVTIYLQSGRFLTDPLYTSIYAIDSYTTAPLLYTGTNPTYLLVDETGTTVASITIPVTQGGNSCVLSNFTSTTLTVASGSSVILTWSAQNCSSLSIDQGVGDVTGLTSKTVTPTATTTYTITGSFGAATASVTITVSSAPCAINTFTASPNPTIDASKLYWTTTNCANAYIIDPTNAFISVPVNNPTDGYLVNVTAASTDYYLFTAPNEPQQKVTIIKTAACEITNQSAVVNPDLSVTVSFNIANCTDAKITGGYFGFSGTSKLSQTSNYTGIISATTAANEMSSVVTSMTYYIDAWSTAPNGTIAIEKVAVASYAAPVCHISTGRRLNSGLAQDVGFESATYKYDLYGTQTINVSGDMNNVSVPCGDGKFIGMTSPVNTTAKDSQGNTIKAYLKGTYGFSANSVNPAPTVIFEYQTPAKIEIK